MPNQAFRMRRAADAQSQTSRTRRATCVANMALESLSIQRTTCADMHRCRSPAERQAHITGAHCGNASANAPRRHSPRLCPQPDPSQATCEGHLRRPVISPERLWRTHNTLWYCSAQTRYGSCPKVITMVQPATRSVLIRLNPFATTLHTPPPVPSSHHLTSPKSQHEQPHPNAERTSRLVGP